MVRALESIQPTPRQAQRLRCHGDNREGLGLYQVRLYRLRRPYVYASGELAESVSATFFRSLDLSKKTGNCLSRSQFLLSTTSLVAVSVRFPGEKRNLEATTCTKTHPKNGLPSWCRCADEFRPNSRCGCNLPTYHASEFTDADEEKWGIYDG